MNTFQAINERYSYRGKYLPTPVPREHLMKIMEAGCAAPSGCNKQTTSFIAVDDPAILAQLAEIIGSTTYVPLRKFCDNDFSAEFAAEALLTWTMNEKTFEEYLDKLVNIYKEVYRVLKNTGSCKYVYSFQPETT